MATVPRSGYGVGDLQHSRWQTFKLVLLFIASRMTVTMIQAVGSGGKGNRYNGGYN